MRLTIKRVNKNLLKNKDVDITGISFLSFNDLEDFIKLNMNVDEKRNLFFSFIGKSFCTCFFNKDLDFEVVLSGDFKIK